jgi:mRNA-degrading endonuclease toxin of MazEF toxin-antitoxin module
MRAPLPLRGEIWFVDTPGQPYDPHQPRLSLVVSSNARNRNSDDVIVVPIFSNGNLGPTRIPIASGVGGISHDSILFCEEITTLHVDFIRHGPLGRPVSADLLDQVVRAVRRALGEVVAEPGPNVTP